MPSPEGIAAAVERAEAVRRRQVDVQRLASLANQCAIETMAGMHSREGRRVLDLKAALRSADNEGDIIAIAEELVRTEDEMRRLGRIHDAIVAAGAG